MTRTVLGTELDSRREDPAQWNVVQNNGMLPLLLVLLFSIMPQGIMNFANCLLCIGCRASLSVYFSIHQLPFPCFSNISFHCRERSFAHKHYSNPLYGLAYKKKVRERHKQFPMSTSISSHGHLWIRTLPKREAG